MAACSRNRSGGGHRQCAAASVVCVDALRCTRDIRNIDFHVDPGASVSGIYALTDDTSNCAGRGQQERPITFVERINACGITRHRYSGDRHIGTGITGVNAIAACADNCSRGGYRHCAATIVLRKDTVGSTGDIRNIDAHIQTGAVVLRR